MAVPNLSWSQADTEAILIDKVEDAWLAGIVKDVLITPSGNVIVATNTGSVWSVSDAGAGVCLLDTELPDFWCTAQGTDGPDHIYAGGDGLFETDLSQSLPLLSWTNISFKDSTGNSVTKYFRIVASDRRRVVVATSSGVFWAEVPPAPENPGCLAKLFGFPNPKPRQAYTWKQAQGLPPGAFAGLAISSLGVGGLERVVVAAWGPDVGSGLFGIFLGEWDSLGNQLEFRRASIEGVDASQMAYTVIASCNAFRGRMYASSSDTSGNLLALLTSTDGGMNWSKLPGNVEGGPGPPKTIYDLCMGQGNDSNDGGRPTNTVAVGPITPGRVALGWRAGPFLSENGGRSFTLIQREYDSTGGSPRKYAHLHADFHALVFDPTDPNGERLFLASDGGIARTDDLGLTFVSKYNQRLLNLELLGRTASREFYGNLDISPAEPGLLGVGSQDNGNLWCRLKGTTTPWTFLEGGDGRTMAFLQNGALVHYFGDDDRPQLSLWNGSQFQYQGVIPYQPGHEIHSPTFDKVRFPVHRNPGGQLLYGIAGADTNLYGLYADDNGGQTHWEYLGSTPTGLNHITCAASIDGQTILAATAGGRIFRFNPPDNFAHELSVGPLPGPDGDPNRVIHHIVMGSDTLAFASYNRTDGSSGSVLAWTGHTWNLVLGSFPNEFIYALTLDVLTGDLNLYVATDDKVYGSGDWGVSWANVSAGLPKRPHCSDFCTAKDQDGVHLFLSTFGRSVWVANLLSEISLPPR